MADIIDKGYPFTLICLNCGNHYESCYNDQPCPKCGDTKEKRWIFHDGFEKEIPDPYKCTIACLSQILPQMITIDFKFDTIGIEELNVE